MQCDFHASQSDTVSPHEGRAACIRSDRLLSIVVLDAPPRRHCPASRSAITLQQGRNSRRHGVGPCHPLNYLKAQPQTVMKTEESDSSQYERLATWRFPGLHTKPVCRGGGNGSREWPWWKSESNESGIATDTTLSVFVIIHLSTGIRNRRLLLPWSIRGVPGFSHVSMCSRSLSGTDLSRHFAMRFGKRHGIFWW